MGIFFLIWEMLLLCKLDWLRIRMDQKNNFFKIIIAFCIILLPILIFSAPPKIEKIKFRHVKFKGEEKLKYIIKSEKGREFDPRLVKLDKILITNYYKKNGFLDASVEDSLLRNRKEKSVQLFYTVNEGRRYFYSRVQFRGYKDVSIVKLAETFKSIKPGTPFDIEKITSAVKMVENLYYNSGKPFAKTEVNYLREQDSLITVNLDIEENRTVNITDIRFEGLNKVKPYLVSRELEIKTGEIYNRKKIDASQKNLYGTGLFKYVRMEIEPVSQNPEQARLKISFQEKDAKWLGVRFGVAHEQETSYGSKLELTLQGGHRNVFGSGRSVSLHITPSLSYDFKEHRLHNPDNKINLQFVQPRIFNYAMPLSLNLLYAQFRPLKSGDFDLWRAGLEVRRKFRNIHQISTSVSAKLVNLLSDQAVDSIQALTYRVDRSKVYALTFYYKRDNRRNVFDPKRSAYTDVSTALSYAEGRDADGSLIKNNYISLIASWQRYQPWRPQILDFRRWKFTLATRLKAGAIFEPFGRKPIPISDLFFAGGATTVRGYQEQLLGPAASKDKNEKIETAAGGKLLYLMNGELRIPLFWLFVGTYFIDGGYVWPEITDFNISDIRLSTGIGLALMTPLGPIRVDYGYKLTRRKIDPTPDSFHIGIYFAF